MKSEVAALTVSVGLQGLIAAFVLPEDMKIQFTFPPRQWGTKGTRCIATSCTEQVRTDDSLESGHKIPATFVGDISKAYGLYRRLPDARGYPSPSVSCLGTAVTA